MTCKRIILAHFLFLCYFVSEHRCSTTLSYAPRREDEYRRRSSAHSAPLRGRSPGGRGWRASSGACGRGGHAHACVHDGSSRSADFHATLLSPSRPWSVSTLVVGRVGCSVGHPVPPPLVMDSLLRMLHPPCHQPATSPPI